MFFIVQLLGAENPVNLVWNGGVRVVTDVTVSW
jgi:hypothetical protein